VLTERIASVFQIRPGEAKLVGWVAALFAFLELGRNIGANAADGLFLIRFGAAYLPLMTIALGVLAFFVTLSYTIGLSRFKKRVFFVAVLGALGAILLIERIALFFDWAPLFPILWLTINIMSSVLGTLMWNIAAEVCDTRQAKRLFSLFTSAGIFGGVVGNLITGMLAKSLGTENLLLLYAILLFAGLASSREIARQYFRPAAVRQAGTSWIDDLRVGFDFVRSSRLMHLIALSSILFSILYFSVYIPFSQVASVTYPNEADLAGFLGLMSGAVTVITLVISLFIANRLYARIGVVNAVLILPITYLVGFVLFALNGSIVIAVAVRMSQMIVLNGVASAAWSAFFNVVPPEKRSQVQSFDGGVTAQMGTVLSGLLPLIASRFLTTTQIFAAGMLAALVTGYLVWRMRYDYGAALVEALRAGFLDVFTATRRGFQSISADANARRAVFDGLTDALPARRRLAAEVLGKMDDRSAIEPLTHALDDSDVEVRRAAIDALIQLNAPSALDAIARRVGDPDASVRACALDALSAWSAEPRPEYAGALQDPVPRVQARAVVALHKTGDAPRAQHAIAALLESTDANARAAGLDAVADIHAGASVARVGEFLDDPALAVRLAAIKALGAFQDRQANAWLVAKLDDPDERVREAAAMALQVSGVDAETLSRVLNTGSERAQRAVLIALQGRGAAAQKILIDWARLQIPRAAQYRAWLVSLSRADGNASHSVLFLRDLLREREWGIEQRVLQALALIAQATSVGTPGSIRLIAQGLKSQDHEMRAQALEALDTLGDRQIAHGLVPLLEDSAASSAPQDPRLVLSELTMHRDPWLRAFAVRALTGLLARDWQTIVARARQDSDELVRQATVDAIDARGEEMAETLRTLGTMDRILFLRQVPLFSDLAPEDLQQIAEVATERVFTPNDYLCREGEIGDELFVIVDGQVRVTKGSNGQGRTLRILKTGEHIGELAILREQPRSASVVAEEGNVRALAIRGGALKAILRDRPEVAMAMLATLAHRMSTLA